MTDKKALLIAAIAASEEHAAIHDNALAAAPIGAIPIPAAHNPDPINVDALSDNRFATYINRLDRNGFTQKVTTAEYHVWTKEEADAFGYASGGLATSDPLYRVFRIF